jgi:hypothetical protein
MSNESITDMFASEKIHELFGASDQNEKVQTSDDVVKRTLVQSLVYRASDLISLSDQIVVKRNLNDLEAKWHVPDSFNADYPVGEGALSPRRGITWYEFKIELMKCMVRFMMTDEARIRGVENWQWETSLRRTAEAIAGIVDANVIDTLFAYHYTSNDTAADNYWDVAAGTPEDDIIATWGNILANANVTEAQLRAAKLVTPIAVYPYLLQLQLINNVQQTTAGFITNSFGITFLPTRRTSSKTYGWSIDSYDAALSAFDGTDALLCIKSPDAAVFGQYSGEFENAVETRRIEGVGNEYMVRRFFNTKVMDRSSSDSTTAYLGAITGVDA